VQRSRLSGLDPEFLTIYFMRGTHLDRKVAYRRVWVIFGALLAVFALLGARVWLEMQNVKVGYELHQLKAERLHLRETQQALLTQRNSLASLERVETVARTRLGLGLPAKDQTVFIVEAAERPRGLVDVWSVSQAWWERGAAFWRTVIGAKTETGKEARLGG
jgi:cell division protein FtsL